MVAKRPALFWVIGSFSRGGPWGTLHVFTDALLCYALSPSRVLVSLTLGNSTWSSKRTQYFCPQNGQCFHLIAGIYPKNVSIPTVADMHNGLQAFWVWSPSGAAASWLCHDHCVPLWHCIIVTAKYPCCWMSFPSEIWGPSEFLWQWLWASLWGTRNI